MRMVAYSDINSKIDNLLVHSITGALANLIYHKFNSTENEQYFLQVISEILDRFEDSRDYFIENNTTYEEHPTRKESELKHEEKRRRTLMRRMDELQIKGYDPDATADELLEYFNREHELLVKKQLEKNEEEEELTIEDSEEVDVTEVESVETDDEEEITDVTETDENIEDTTDTSEVENDVEEVVIDEEDEVIDVVEEVNESAE